ncbi:MAG TPA: cobalt ECF transporter T component CbiQ [Desulfitobacterium dehalogenans]|uniref:Cobalt ECF transporter T component CbiQ n=1 Tax=Desulfitobacterium dehalogenans TaxID=36854 RepID=A0A7C6Z604_9FIRM|nr:cobalt ECF transporter T component CbiQ [Desulfitobacterium dehalogenans]
MLNTDTYAYASRLKAIDPMQKFIFAFLTLGVCLWADQMVVSIAVIVLMSGATIVFGGAPFSVWLKLMIVPLSFLVIGIITIAINISRDVHSFLWAHSIAGYWVGISESGIREGINLFFRVLGSVSCLYFLSLSTPMVDLLSVLRRLRLPKLMVEMMGLIYRFIFVLLETAATMLIAQNSRLGYINLRSGYRSMGSMVSVLFIRAYKRSNELYTSLEARGYDGEIKVLEETYENNKNLVFLAALINGVLIFLALFLK